MDDPQGADAGRPVRLHDITPASALRRAAGAHPRAGCRGTGALPAGDRLLHALAAWRRAAGPTAGRRCAVAALEGQTLVIRVPDARWAGEIGRLERRLIAALAAEGLRVKALRCLAAPGDAPPARAPSAAERPRCAKRGMPESGADLMRLFDAIAEHYQRARALTAQGRSARQTRGGMDRPPDR